MPYPPISALPPAPSRVGDPDNFVAESNAFLTAHGTFRMQGNALGDYVDALPINGWHWGMLGDVNPMRAMVTPFGPLPVTGNSGDVFAARSDATLSSMFGLVAQANAVGAFLDALKALTEAMIFQPDPERPTVSMLPVPPSRGNAAAVFESNAQSFYQTLASYASQLGSLADYFFFLVLAADDYGLLGEPLTFTDDWGTL